MFRLLRSRTPVVARTATVAGQPAVARVQHARVTRGKVVKRILYGGITVWCAYNILNETVIRPGLSRILDEVEKLEEIVEEDDDEYEDWFVPLPVFEAVRQPPYSGSGPEWQRFAEFNKQTPEAQRERQRICRVVHSVVYQTAANSKPITARYGKIHDWVQSHLFIAFPPAPPPKILQLGWVPFASDGGPSLRTRRTDLKAWRRTMRTFWPVPAVYASASFLRTLWQDTVAEGRSALGLPPSTPPQENVQVRIPILPRVSAFPNPQKGGEEGRGPESSNRPGIPGSGPMTPRSPTNATPTTTAADRSLPEASGSGTEEASGRGATGLGGKQQEQTRRGQQQEDDEADKPQLPLFKRVPAPTELIDKSLRDRAFSKFMDELTPRWGLPPNLPPDGCVEISGVAYVKTDRYKLQLDVRAHYDLAKKQLDKDSMRLSVKTVATLARPRP